MRWNLTTEERFWAKVAKGSQPDACWEWQAGLVPGGYGDFRPGGTKASVRAHRFSWEMACGPIPDGLFVLHRCDNRLCVRPDHLFLGTKRDNTQDMVQKGRAGWVHKRDHWRRGESVNTAKLAPSQVREIRTRHAHGEVAAHLAREFGITQPSCWSLLRRESWAHID